MDEQTQRKIILLRHLTALQTVIAMDSPQELTKTDLILIMEDLIKQMEEL